MIILSLISYSLSTDRTISIERGLFVWSWERYRFGDVQVRLIGNQVADVNVSCGRFRCLYKSVLSLQQLNSGTCTIGISKESIEIVEVWRDLMRQLERRVVCVLGGVSAARLCAHLSKTSRRAHTLVVQQVLWELRSLQLFLRRWDIPLLGESCNSFFVIVCITRLGLCLASSFFSHFWFLLVSESSVK